MPDVGWLMRGQLSNIIGSRAARYRLSPAVRHPGRDSWEACGWIVTRIMGSAVLSILHRVLRMRQLTGLLLLGLLLPIQLSIGLSAVGGDFSLGTSDVQVNALRQAFDTLCSNGIFDALVCKYTG